MKAILLLAPFLAVSAHAAACPAGYWDLGPHAASLGMRCGENPGEASIVFCQRKALLEKGLCTGASHSVPCKENRARAAWFCEEGGNYPFTVMIQGLEGDKIRYVFQSSFNRGELIGTRLTPADE